MLAYWCTKIMQKDHGRFVGWWHTREIVLSCLLIKKNIMIFQFHANFCNPFIKYVWKTSSNVGNNLSIISWHHKPIVREIPRSVGFNLRMHIQDWQGYQKIRQTWSNRKKMISIQNWIMVLDKANLKWMKYAPCLFSYAVVI